MSVAKLLGPYQPNLKSKMLNNYVKVCPMLLKACSC